MDVDATIVAIFSGAAGAALSVMAACSRYNRLMIIPLVLIAATLSAAPVYSQVAGKEPGWFLQDESKSKQPETKPGPKVKIIEHKIEHKTVVIIRKPAVRHHHHLKKQRRHNHGHWHRCRGLFFRYWCWKR